MSVALQGKIPELCSLVQKKVNDELKLLSPADSLVVEKYNFSPDIDYCAEFVGTDLPIIVQRAVAHRSRTLADFLYQPTVYERALISAFSLDIKALREKFPYESIVKTDLPPKSSRTFKYCIDIFRPYAKYSLHDFFKRVALLEERAYFQYPRKVRNSFDKKDAVNFAVTVYPKTFQGVTVVELLWAAGENTEKITGSKVYRKFVKVQCRQDVLMLDSHIEYLCRNGCLPLKLKMQDDEFVYENALRIVTAKNYVRRVKNRVPRDTRIVRPHLVARRDKYYYGNFAPIPEMLKSKLSGWLHK